MNLFICRLRKKMKNEGEISILPSGKMENYQKGVGNIGLPSVRWVSDLHRVSFSL